MGFKERVKAVRAHFGLSQQAFADKIGVARNTIAKYEYEGRNPEGPVVELICREFGISRKWLSTGEGEMLLPTEERLIAEVSAKYHLYELDRAILKLYLRLDADGRAKLRLAAVEIANAVTVTPGLFDQLSQRADASFQRGPSAPKNVHDWTREEAHAELDRQFDGEADDQKEDAPGVSGCGPPASASA